MSARSEGSEAYAQLAEELDDPRARLDWFEPAVVAAAQEHAKRSHRRWPPRPTRSGWSVSVTSV
jgi:hypothetical protein